MSFFKFKSSSTTQGSTTNSAQGKKDPNAPPPTPLEKHLADVSGPVRPDGSDKFFGLENYGSTCYANSIIQCLYYSAPFRDNVLNFPPIDVLQELRTIEPNGRPKVPRIPSVAPYPNPTSPARKPFGATTTTPGSPKPEESKDSPDYRKKLAIQAGPVLGMTDDNADDYWMDESLFTSLRDIFEAITANSSRLGVLSPHRFLDILRRENDMFRSAMHQDAHEFLNLLLNQVVDNAELFAKQNPKLAALQASGGAQDKSWEKSLSTALSVSTRGLHNTKDGLDTRWVHDLFEGLLTSETRCLTCENTSQRDEAFLDLSVDLSPHTSVTSCLRKFSEEEMLCERNKFHCDNCGGLQEAEKRMKIKRLPRILALHLKRFKYTEDLQRLQKLFHRVQYPFHLRLFNTTDDAEDPDRLYELYAVVVHIGGGPYHGHYVSIIKTEDRGWLLFDDELVEPVDKSYVMNFFGGEPLPGVQDATKLACAYLLFYQETTLEAVLREQDMEGGGATHVEARVSNDTAVDPSSPIKSGNGIFHTASNQTPATDDLVYMDPLVHAVTAPNMPNIAEATQRPPFSHLQSTPLTPTLPTRTKKELKQEEKERQKAKKAEEKVAEEKRRAEERAADDKRKEFTYRHVEAWRKADAEMKQALEVSKQTAAVEATTRGEAPLPSAPPKEKESGLARFKSGSMSLRKKPTMFGKEKDKEAVRLPPIPPANGSAGLETTSSNGEQAMASDEDTTVPSQPRVDEKIKKHRFSLGRKKSTIMR